MIPELAAAVALAVAPAPNTSTADGHVPVDPRPAIVRPYRAQLMRVAWCESRRRWHIATGNGFYGGLQFTLSSWRAAGGRGYPHWHSALEQLYRAVRLLHLQGWGAWPVCGHA